MKKCIMCGKEYNGFFEVCSKECHLKAEINRREKVARIKRENALAENVKGLVG